MHDNTTTKQRIGERHPILLGIARTVVYTGLFVSFILGVATVATVHATSVQNYKNAHSFIPVHSNLK